MRYAVELPAYIEEDATIIEHSIQAIDEIADYIVAHAGNTTLEEVPQLLDDIRNINVVLSSHADQLRGVIVNMRKYTSAWSNQQTNASDVRVVNGHL